MLDLLGKDEEQGAWIRTQRYRYARSIGAGWEEAEWEERRKYPQRLVDVFLKESPGSSIIKVGFPTGTSAFSQDKWSATRRSAGCFFDNNVTLMYFHHASL